MDKINFEEIAQITLDTQDKLAETWAARIVECVNQAAANGQDRVYLCQITNNGYVYNLKQYFTHLLMEGKINYEEMSLFDDLNAMYELSGLETLDTQPYAVIEKAADIAGCKLQITSNAICWDKRISALRGDEALPF